MSLDVKRRIVAGVLVLSAIWPTAHYFVIRRLGLNPWNWFGWAMYTQPSKRIRAHAFSPGGATVTSMLGTVTKQQGDTIMRAYRPWSILRLELGELAPPDDFARAILSVFSQWTSVRIEVERYALMRETASIGVDSVRSYNYSRADVGL
ncbi:MAG: hypothetical protein ACI8QZ_001964 [Chlamydiales bacterium]|jgi:hypothetical protein